MEERKDKPKYYTQAGNKASQKYQKEKLEQMNIRVKKGLRQRYADYASYKSMPLSRLIIDLLEREIKNDGWEQ